MGTGGLFLRKIRATIDDEPTGFAWVEPGEVAASGYPASRTQVEWIVKQGIKAILTLTEEPLPDDYVEGLDLATGHVPMKDHQPPTTESMQRGADFIEARVKEGKPVAVHCLAGEGRTGCVLAAYLIEEKGSSAPEALRTLRAIKPEFVERGQESSVMKFASSFGTGGSTVGPADPNPR